MKKIMPMHTNLVEEILTTEKDVRKFDNGNIAAGRRARKKMQVIRKQAKMIRIEIQIARRERRNAKKTESN